MTDESEVIPFPGTQRSKQELIRLEKLSALRTEGFTFPNDVNVTLQASGLDGIVVPEEPSSGERYTAAGRIVQQRLMGKAAFIHIQDATDKLQLYIRKDDIGEESFAQFKTYDRGDIVEASGYVFVTKTGEKTLHVETLRLLTKSIQPLPEKWSGLTDVEARYRYRYLDLISNPEVRETFQKRALVIKEMRNFLEDRGYIAVETPILGEVAGGATARPFLTHFNALHADMSLRIALELPLKKLIVGGFDRVYEIGRVFRNEGLSKKHNPEFTMIEFYQAYATFHDMMDLTEKLFVTLAEKVVGGMKVPFGENEIDFSSPWPRMSMSDSLYEIGGVSRDIDVQTLSGVQQVAKEHKIHLEEPDDWGRCLEECWGELVEPKIVNPVFITHHPFSISPLARKNEDDPKVTDRFELIIAGMEMANAFSELNDPIDQRERFEAQADRKALGDEEAPPVDEDFLRALEVGMPPTAGEGIGIDRLTMLLTNSPTIRDVLLFPQLKSRKDDGGLEEVVDEGDVAVS